MIKHNFDQLKFNQPTPCHFKECSAYKIQLHGIEWNVSLSADWDQSPTKKKKKKVIRTSISFREKLLMILELDSSLVRNRPITFSQRKLSSSKVLIFALPLNICFVFPLSFRFVGFVTFFSQRLLLELHIKIVTKCNGKIFTFSSLNICK